MALDGTDVCQRHDACYFEPADHAALAAMVDTTLLVYGLPRFS